MCGEEFYLFDIFLHAEILSNTLSLNFLMKWFDLCMLLQDQN
jgi:hypothetical protein